MQGCVVVLLIAVLHGSEGIGRQFRGKHAKALSDLEPGLFESQTGFSIPKQFAEMDLEKNPVSFEEMMDASGINPQSFFDDIVQLMKEDTETGMFPNGFRTAEALRANPNFVAETLDEVYLKTFWDSLKKRAIVRGILHDETFVTTGLFQKMHEISHTVVSKNVKVTKSQVTESVIDDEQGTEKRTAVQKPQKTLFEENLRQETCCAIEFTAINAELVDGVLHKTRRTEMQFSRPTAITCASKYYESMTQWWGRWKVNLPHHLSYLLIFGFLQEWYKTREELSTPKPIDRLVFSPETQVCCQNDAICCASEDALDHFLFCPGPGTNDECCAEKQCCDLGTLERQLPWADLDLLSKNQMQAQILLLATTVCG